MEKKAFGFSVLPKDIVTRCIGAILILLVINNYILQTGILDITNFDGWISHGCGNGCWNIGCKQVH